MTIEVPEFAETAVRPRSAELDRELRMTTAVFLYDKADVPLGRAAAAMGVAQADLIDELARREIEVFKVDIDELRREVGLD